MSWQPAPAPAPAPSPCAPVEGVVRALRKDLGGGFVVRRVLPSPKQRMVGPFLFLDHMGPATLPAGRGLDVRPHPHIHLETLTYLFEGAILHRDSLGTEQRITPGALNWMTAGRGIVHSERSPAEEREKESTIHGMQAWVALPRAREDEAPRFVHVPAAELPLVERGGARLRVVAGDVYGAASPMALHAPLFYVDAQLEEGARVALPDARTSRAEAAVEGRAFYVVEGEVEVGGARFEPGRLGVARRGVEVELHATAPSRVMLLGGQELGPRHLFWNFASTSAEAIEQAKTDWREGNRARFPLVPGDEAEHIPLPGE
ncbi:MAG TPA: pirin family protein [Polyangiaceae bacterium LLY-WYZ-15_(1-7)]|nr:pirin family protein [Polyangiaceae bacterium LLY-WYZ-15_(1-7)]HJL09125.1 pirin family protein [Polyangiaceae bacterium LLY-WYZ-15_(1-7)]HJL22954.1 pirin family protein [Polyangiaceae bacterium LLY-WYZ-15_(1-7)]HJL38229.1 pirin family protein [Polyangiaceae bacterium LLY-WYZ-15_(1-7)]